MKETALWRDRYQCPGCKPKEWPHPLWQLVVMRWWRIIGGKHPHAAARCQSCRPRAWMLSSASKVPALTTQFPWQKGASRLARAQHMCAGGCAHPEGGQAPLLPQRCCLFMWRWSYSTVGPSPDHALAPCLLRRWRRVQSCPAWSKRWTRRILEGPPSLRTWTSWWPSCTGARKGGARWLLPRTACAHRPLSANMARPMCCVVCESLICMRYNTCVACVCSCLSIALSAWKSDGA